MKALLIIPIFLFSLLFAQTESSKWYLGLQGGAGQSFRTLEPTSEDEIILIDILNGAESPITGMNGGLVLGRKITDHIWLESGIQVSRLGKMIYSKRDSQIVDPALPDETKFIDLYYHLNIPLLLKAYTNRGKFRGLLFYGGQFNFKLDYDDKRVEIFYDGFNRFSVSNLSGDFHPVVLSLVGGAGVSFNPHERFSIEGRFLARRDITPIADAPIRQKMHYVAGNIIGAFHF